MEIDNDRRASVAKAILISTPFVLLLGNGLLAIFLLIHTWVPTIISGVLVILGWGITVLLRLQSVKVRLAEETLTILYYPITPITSKFRRIDIAWSQISGYEFRSSMLGLRKELILFEEIDGETASYPAVTVTLFGKAGIAAIETLFKQADS